MKLKLFFLLNYIYSSYNFQPEIKNKNSFLDILSISFIGITTIVVIIYIFFKNNKKEKKLHINLEKNNQLTSFEILDFIEKIIKNNQDLENQETNNQEDIKSESFIVNLKKNQNFENFLNLLIKEFLQIEQQNNLEQQEVSLSQQEKEKIEKLLKNEFNNFKDFLQIIEILKNKNNFFFFEEDICLLEKKFLLFLLNKYYSYLNE